ncbi:TPA: hypothetical protein L9L52_003150 [Klebsiella quasipneumoniae subsp. quasipneumoniae]|nr:hypothetical protein [Klebsiella quasipneumoniae subsp. similipneumoniae]HBR1460292.1 hypothetical protein [Klebsiella quasipneumoniae subsp. quasipneumoniae]HBR2034401.1 hypothetical protein [Klebsiella quasipneumoniae subsp. quasipneumoniae]
MANLRDDFVGKVKEKLRARVGNKCSNPDCRVYTTGPGTKDKIDSIGVAAHICAASPGGPRYDINMTAKQRKSFDNGIWLCSNCSIHIDRDVERYTVHLLNKWKKEAEEKARRELGKKAAEPDDAINTVAMALTGYPKSFLSQSIGNVHKATAKLLEEKDPRFKVTSSFDGENTMFTLCAQPGVCIKMGVLDDKVENYIQGYKDFVEGGESLSLNAKHVTMTGSPLIEEIMSQKDGRLIISKETKNALAKISLVEPKTGIIESLDDICGEITHGTQRVTFKGVGYGSLLNMDLSISISERKGINKFSLNLDRWNELSLNRLPFFSKIYSLFDKMYRGWKVNCNVEIDGESIFHGELSVNKSSAYAKNINALLSYVHHARIILNELALNAFFINTISFTREKHHEVILAAKLLQQEYIYHDDCIITNPSFTLIINEENKKIIMADKASPGDFRFDSENGECLNLFGVDVILPRKRLFYHNVKFNIIDDLSTIENGMEVKVEIVPDKGFIGREVFIR